MSLKQMVDVISQSNRNLFPVVDNDGMLMGVVLLDDIRNIMFRPDLYKRMFVNKFMTAPPAKIEIGDTMENVMKTLESACGRKRQICGLCVQIQDFQLISSGAASLFGGLGIGINSCDKKFFEKNR